MFRVQENGNVNKLNLGISSIQIALKSAETKVVSECNEINEEILGLSHKMLHCFKACVKKHY